MHPTHTTLGLPGETLNKITGIFSQVIKQHDGRYCEPQVATLLACLLVSKRWTASAQTSLNVLARVSSDDQAKHLADHLETQVGAQLGDQLQYLIFATAVTEEMATKIVYKCPNLRTLIVGENFSGEVSFDLENFLLLPNLKRQLNGFVSLTTGKKQS